MDLSPFFAETDNVQYTTVYEDDLFIRTKAAVRISPDMAMTVVKDVHVNESVSLYSFSIAIEKEVSDPLTFTIGRDIEMLSQHNYALLAKKDDIICMPGKPVQREYNIDGNILCDSEHQIDSQFQCTKNTLTMELDCVESSFVTFQYIIFQEHRNTFLDQLCIMKSDETRHVKAYLFFDYCSLKQVWDYFVNGDIYHVDYSKKQSLRWPCQQCANMLYGYLRYLYCATKKEIYAVLCRQIAYSVMLNLPDDGRWKHGHWTDAMETHTRHQIDGVDLLVSAYEDFGSAIFLDSAKKSMDYLISIAEPLEKEQVWFLHDTLESDRDLDNLKKIFVGFFVSAAFNKSHSNTLCLNTHVWTLAVLKRLNKHCLLSEYSKIFNKGESALETVLRRKPGTAIYYILYRVRDSLIALSVHTNRHTFYKYARKYTRLLKEHLLPFFKKRYPRLLMPNGFLERDLTAVHVSDLYFFVNMQDLLLLYTQKPSGFLRQVIESAVVYSHKSGLSKYFLKSDHRGVIYVNILLLCILHFQQQKYLDLLIEYLLLLKAQGCALSAELFGNWAFGARYFNFTVIPNDQFHFSLVTRGRCFGVITNLSPHTQRYEIYPEKRELNYEVIFRRGILSSDGQDRIYELEPGGYLFLEFPDIHQKTSVKNRTNLR